MPWILRDKIKSAKSPEQWSLRLKRIVGLLCLGSEHSRWIQRVQVLQKRVHQTIVGFGKNRSPEREIRRHQVCWEASN